jgi:hypothetical protein
MYAKAINKKELESDFIKCLNEVTPKKEFLVVFKTTVLDVWGKKGFDFKIDAQNYERQLTVLEEKRGSFSLQVGNPTLA